MRRNVCLAMAVVLLTSLIGVGHTYQYCETGDCATGFFTNLTGQEVNGLILRCSSIAEPAQYSIGIGADMTVSETAGGEIIYEGPVMPNGMWEVGWAVEDYCLESAAWTCDGEIVEEIDVHVPNARLIAYAGSDLTMCFFAAGSIDPDGFPLESYVWEFADGVVLEGFRVARDYDAPGTGSVTLTVRDSEGKEASVSREFEVMPPQIPNRPLPLPLLIAFTGFTEGTRDIYVIREDGTGLRQVTRDPGNDYAPQWSPDGSQIAFVSERLGYPAIFVINADGTGERLLVDLRAKEFHWGESGAFVFTHGTSGDLYRIDTDGTDLQLIYGGTMWGAPTVSPDGSMVAGNGDSDVLLVNYDGTGFTTIPNPELHGSRASWRYDSRYVVWHGHEYTQIVDVVSESRTTIATYPGSGKPSQPFWDPTGQYIVQGNPHSGDSTSLLYIYDFEGNLVAEINNETARPYEWSPRGDTIAVVAEVSGSRYLATMDAATHDVNLLHTPFDSAEYVDWGPPE